MSSTSFTILKDDVLKVFASLGVSEMQGIHKKALKASANVLVKEARVKLAGVTTKHASMQKGIRSYVSKNVDFAKVHIMGDFRLKFFEMGAGWKSPRITRKGQDRGIMEARPFFSPAINAAKGRMAEVMRKTIIDAVNKRAKQ